MSGEKAVLHLIGRDCTREEAAFALALAERQSATGIKAVIACPEDSWTSGRTTALSLPVEHLSLSSAINPFEWRRVAKLAQSVEADCILSHDQTSTSIAGHAGRKHGGMVYRRINKSASYEKADSVFHCSEYAVEELPDRADAKHVLLYAGGDEAKAKTALDNRDKERATLKAEFCPEKEKPLFLYYSADFIEKNRHQLLLEALPDILTKLPQVHLLLAGDGEHLAELERQCRITALENDVTFIEVDDDPYGVMTAVDIYVSPRQDDPAGFMTQIAMLSGRAVVAARSGLNPELIDHDKNGILVEGETAAEYCQVLLDVLQNRNRREHFGRMAAARAAKTGLTAAMNAIAEKLLS
jgi:Glycosyltransferase